MELPPRRMAAAACSEADAVAFQRDNRCPLYPGRLNRWVLRRTLVGRPTDADMLGEVAVVLGRWFAAANPWGVPARSLVGNVRGLSRRRLLSLPCDVVKSCEDVRPAPLMIGDSFASLAIEFLYFGREPSLPWPVLDAFGGWTPFECVWALDAVGVPPDELELERVPTGPDWVAASLSPESECACEVPLLSESSSRERVAELERQGFEVALVPAPHGGTRVLKRRRVN